MLKKPLILILVFLATLSSSFSAADLKVDHSLDNGNIYITVDGDSYLSLVEVFKGPFDPNVRPETIFIGTINLQCGDVCNDVKSISKSFDSLGIYQPGDYYFVVKDVKEESVRIDFKVGTDNLLSCDYNGIAVKNNNCVNSFTNKNEDKPLYCRNQEIFESCAGPGFCGCPSQEQICCTNENLAECKGNIGKCVYPGAERFEKEVVIEEKVVKQQLEELGCIFSDGIKIPENVCANNIVPGLLADIGNNLFGYICECQEINEKEIDKDNDGYDPISLGGTDCRDEVNPAGCPLSPIECDLAGNKEHISCPVCINPGAIESCEIDLGNNNVDEDCDGKDLDCSFNCDSDGDGFLDSTSLICKTVAKLSGKQTETNDNNAKINPAVNEICDGMDNNQNGLIDENLINCATKNLNANNVVAVAEIKSSPEICGDKIDNNGNGEIDESSCDCVDGQTEIIKGICSNGERICRNGKWNVNVEPVNSCSPLLFVDGFDGRNNAVGVSRNSVITISASFVCQEEECNNIEVRI